MVRISTWVAAALIVVVIALGGIQLLLVHYPQFQRLKNRALPFLIVDPGLEIPNTSRGDRVSPPSLPEADYARNSFRDKLETLVVTTYYQLDENSPGGLLIDVRFSRRGNLFGRYSSYDRQRLRNHIADIIQLGRDRGKRMLIIDEGEGGYVMRTGQLPPAFDIGRYLFNGTIASTLEGRVDEAVPFRRRSIEVRRLFDTFAAELRRQRVDVILAPVLDAAGPSPNTTVDDRTFSSDYEEIELGARHYIEAMRARGLLVVAKHFPNLPPATNLDPHDGYMINAGTEEEFDAVFDLYRRLKDEIDGVMLSHRGDPRAGGLPGTISEITVSTLTDSIGFDGVIITNELHMSGLIEYVESMPMNQRQIEVAGQMDDPVLRAAILAFDAGVSQVLISRVWPMNDLLDELERLYAVDKRFAKRIDEALRKVAAFRQKRGVYDLNLSS